MSAKPGLLIRAEGNRAVGMGHLKREADLALEMIRRGWEVSLFTQDSDLQASEFFRQITQNKVRHVTDPSAWQDLLRQSRVLVLDVLHRDDDAAWMTELRGDVKIPVSVVTDDSAPRPCFGDALINCNPCRLEEKVRYYADQKIPAYLGPDWFMADPGLGPARKQYRFSGRLRKIGMIFGGVDEHNTTGMLLDYLRNKIDRLNLSVEVLQSPVSRFREENIRKFVHPGICFHSQLESLSGFLLNCDLLLASHGNAAYEACLVGVPMIAVNQVPRQNEQAEEMERRGAVINAGMDNALRAGKLDEVFEDPGKCPERLRRQSETKRRLVDGEGLRRTGDLIHSLGQMK